ncbi:MAG: hypothetical protein E7671_00515 [Ruminococcaceae bacterium]|nr:hypothetical protein [Oscillospiraceae bacterium]
MQENLIKNMVRVGIVTSVDKPKRRVRVHFPDMNIVSDFLYVLKNPPFIPDIDVPQCTEEAEAHTHDIVIKPWLPSVNDKVLCLYIPCENGDGFVLGAI